MRRAGARASTARRTGCARYWERSRCQNASRSCFSRSTPPPSWRLAPRRPFRSIVLPTALRRAPDHSRVRAEKAEKAEKGKLSPLCPLRLLCLHLLVFWESLFMGVGRAIRAAVYVTVCAALLVRPAAAQETVNFGSVSGRI